MTEKQKQFCVEYLKDLNATQAAIRSGYKENSARVIGCENLTKPDIKQEIDKRLEEILGANKKAIEARLIEEIQKIAFTEVDDETIVRVGDKLKAGEMLGRYLAIWTDKRIIDERVTLTDLLSDIDDDESKGG